MPGARLPDPAGRPSAQMLQRWHDRLQAHPGHPAADLPERLLGRLTAVVEWLARSTRERGSPDDEIRRALHLLGTHWRDGGAPVELALDRIDLLGEVVYEALGDGLRDLADGPAAAASAVEAAEASWRVSRGLRTAQKAVVAAYRDAEEERFADFGATMAHEVQGHLGSALGAMKLVRLLEDEGSLSAEKRDDLFDGIEHSLEHTTRLVSSVWALSRTADAPATDRNRRPLRTLVERVVADAAADADHEVEPRIDDDLPDVLVPKDLTHLILHNLVENAVKYADPGKEDRWARVHAEIGERGELLVHVADNGPGIPRPEQERIFARFRRGRQARGDGFGLGLAIARQAARRLGGGIELESEPGEGSTFTVRIPADAVTDA